MFFLKNFYPIRTKFFLLLFIIMHNINDFVLVCKTCFKQFLFIQSIIWSVCFVIIKLRKKKFDLKSNFNNSNSNENQQTKPKINNKWQCYFQSNKWGSSIWFLCANIYFKIIVPFRVPVALCRCVACHMEIPVSFENWKMAFVWLVDGEKWKQRPKIDPCWQYVTHCVYGE